MAGAPGGSRGLGEALELIAEWGRTLLAAFQGESLRLRAMALAFLSLFATVPALVVAFSVVNAFAGLERLWAGLEEFLIANLAVGERAVIEPRLQEFVRNAHATSAGLVGALFLVGSLVLLFGYVESALNDIWFVRRRRPFAQKALIYWAGLTLGPLLLAGSLAVAGSPRLRGRLVAEGASLVLICASFAVLYLIVPATRVRLVPALLGGVAGGVSWEVAKHLYTWAARSFFRYHAVYGSVAAVPTFLVWLYVSWTLFLSGSRIAFVAQHRRTLLRGRRGEATPLGKELLAARVMLEVARAFRRGEASPEPEEIAERLSSLAEPVREALGALRAGGLVVEASGGGLLPARQLSRLTLADVRRVVAGAVPEPSLEAAGPMVAGILAAAEGAAAEALAETSLEELCDRLQVEEARREARDTRLPGA